MNDERITRRRALSQMTLAAAGMLAACNEPATGPPVLTSGGLTARPGTAGPMPSPGVYGLNVAATRDALLYLPPGLPVGAPLPLVVALHGDPGSAQLPIQWFGTLAASLGFVLMAPSSREHTWDAILGDFDQDAALIDQALATTFTLVTVDPARIALVGFSDGGTYALALGLRNGDLFRRIVAFSPGFLPNVLRVGMPPVYITHGTSDTVLPIDLCSRRIVPVLERYGYDVTYHEFAGGHTIPALYASEALAWAIGAAPAAATRALGAS